MNYNAKLIKQENYKPTFWSGGMATELITYPLSSDYASKNFLWRLGIAKIDILESTFSILPNVSRNFMVLDGQITLEHENRYKKLLNPFDQDNFMGDWNTKTYGKASVFNLMTQENYHGELIHLSIAPKNQFDFDYNISADKKLVAICFYVLNGNFKSSINTEIFNVDSNGLLLIDDINSSSVQKFILTNTSLDITDIIASIIYHS